MENTIQNPTQEKRTFSRLEDLSAVLNYDPAIDGIPDLTSYKDIKPTHVPVTMETLAVSTPYVISNVYGYMSALGTNNTCGPASMACVMDYYGFAWPDIPKQSNGHYDNETYVRRIMDWSGAPDAVGGVFGTTPMRIVDSMQRLGLKSVWYGNGTAEGTLSCIQNEVSQNRPVLVLLDYGNWRLDWQVVFGFSNTMIYTKISNAGGGAYGMFSYADFNTKLQNNLPNWNRSYITVGH